MKITPEVLKKYANQQCSELEKTAIEQWLKTIDKDQNEEEMTAPSFLEEKLWDNIKKVTVVKPKRKSNVIQKNAPWAIAASIVLLVGLSAFQLFFNPNKIITYQTLPGEMQTITLSDGTLVHLNVNSVLETPKAFTKDNRMVSLIGEAYFEVTKDSLHPFIIQTEKSETKVLGTKFNLSAYPNEHSTLTLDEGKVSFKDQKDSTKELILLPNEQGIIYNGGIKKNIVNTKYYKGWRTKKLYINNETLTTISHKIERTYGVKINIITPKLKAQTYKGAYDALPLETLLEDLSFVLKFNYTIKEKEITIY